MTLKTIAILMLLTLCFVQSYSPAQAHKKPIPAPLSNHHQLFYIQRSKDANIIMYDANVTSDGRFDTEKPVDVYWIRYADKGQREDLSAFQWQMAYGYKQHRTASETDASTISLNAFKKLPIRVTYHHGHPVAMTIINGQSACLERVFVQVNPRSGFIPKIDYIEIYGTHPENKTPVYERINP